MAIDETITYQLPTDWLPALINGDFTGLTDPTDLVALHDFSYGEVNGMRKQGLNLVHWEVIWGDPFFAKYHDGRPYGCLACDCLEAKAHFEKVG